MEYEGHSCQSPEEREKLVRDKIAKEDEMEAQATGDSRLIIEELLRRLGYRDGEIESDIPFEVSTGAHSGTCSTDFIVKIGGRRFMGIKCTMALESRERHIVSFCRVADRMVIPVAVVTDGLTAIVVDTMTGRPLSEGLDSIPDRERALSLLEGAPEQPFPEGDKAEKTRRVLLAFETTGCPRPRN